MNAIDRLISRIKKLNNPTVMGLDLRYEMVPDDIKIKYGDNKAQAFLEFNKRLIDLTYDLIPAIKPNSAFYEKHGMEGLEVLKQTCKYAKEKGMIVILDAKRGDIGSTSTAYSNAYLASGDFEVDFITINPYLGSDGIMPFVEDCKKNNKGLFILVKTSNPSSAELQDLRLENGKTVYETMGEYAQKWGEELIGEYGYSSVAAVVGATHPTQLKELREKLPHLFFLIPGYGAQGGKAEDIALAFKDGIGGIVNASRSLMGAEDVRKEAIRMRDELNQFIK